MPDGTTERVSWFYPFAVGLTRLLLNLFSRWRVVGLERVPRDGPLLVVCNHQSNADPPILVAIMPRIVHLMGKEELFRGPVGLLARRYAAFSVRRGQPDREAIRIALDYLRNGKVVGVFPEGTRSRTGGLIQGKAGVGLLAVRAGCPILPVAIAGTFQLGSPLSLLRRPKIDIIIGEPFEVPRHPGAGKLEAAQAATDEAMRHVAALLPPAMRGVYGGDAAGAARGGRGRA